jgi:hypothetical protein
MSQENYARRKSKHFSIHQIMVYRKYIDYVLPTAINVEFGFFSSQVNFAHDDALGMNLILLKNDHHFQSQTQSVLPN